MILSDLAIKQALDNGDIEITPFNPAHLGSNSYDVTLSPILKTYVDDVLDCRKPNETVDIHIPPEGLVLEAGKLYLASTNELSYTPKHVPKIEGKSSLGRLGLFVHITAGFGDVGFRGYWTLEIKATQPIRIYPNMKIAQLVFYCVQGDVKTTYDAKADAKYANQGKDPVASQMHKNF